MDSAVIILLYYYIVILLNIYRCKINAKVMANVMEIDPASENTTNDSKLT